MKTTSKIVKNNPKTLDEKMALLKAKHQQEIEQETLKDKIERDLGIEVMIYSTGTISFRAYKKYISDRGLTTKKQVRSILNYFKPAKAKAVLTFAGKPNRETEGTFILKCTNYAIKNRTSDVTLEYISQCGNKIQIEIPEGLIDIRKSYNRININSKAMNPDTAPYFVVNVPGASVQQYYGGKPGWNHLYYHGKNEIFINLFKD